MQQKATSLMAAVSAAGLFASSASAEVALGRQMLQAADAPPLAANAILSQETQVPYAVYNREYAPGDGETVVIDLDFDLYPPELFAAIGSDIQVPLEACAEFCELTPGCNAASHFVLADAPRGVTCWLKTMPRTCYVPMEFADPDTYVEGATYMIQWAPPCEVANRPLTTDAVLMQPPEEVEVEVLPPLGAVMPAEMSMGPEAGNEVALPPGVAQTPDGIILPAGSIPAGTPLPPGVTLTPEGIFIPTGAEIPPNTALPPGVEFAPDGTVVLVDDNEFALPPGVAQTPDGIILPAGSIPPGTALPPGVALTPEGIFIPTGADIPPNTALPPGVEFAPDGTLVLDAPVPGIAPMPAAGGVEPLPPLVDGSGQEGAPAPPNGAAGLSAAAMAVAAAAAFAFLA